VPKREQKLTTFMQNKPNFHKAKMNANIYFRKDYGEILWAWSQEKQSQSKPIKASSKPSQSQFASAAKNGRKLFDNKVLHK